jgi:hypothetical protein
MAIFPGTAITPAGGGGYTIDQSLRFNDDDSAYLSRTPASAGNRKTWTWSGWVKRGNLGLSGLFGAGPDNVNQHYIDFTSGDAIQIRYEVGDSVTFDRLTSAVYRDVSAWYHIVVTWDTTQSTASDRIKLYVNGSQVTQWAQDTIGSQNTDGWINSTTYEHYVGKMRGNYGPAEGYMAEVHFIDGQALDASYFGETDEDYGHWKPTAYTGSYGTNGFYLDFSNLGEDQAGSNDWTANNLAATDVVLDSPTNNFATWNPLVKGTQTFSEGNLKCVLGDDFATPWRFGTQAMTTGKWYMEFILVSGYNSIGVAEESTNTNAAYGIAGTAVARYNGDVYLNGTNSAGYLSSFGSTDVLQVAFDADTRKIWFGRNGTFVGDPAAGTSERGTLTSTASNVFLPALGGANSDTSIANFGQDSSFAGNKTAQNNTDDNGVGDFYYAPPSGFLALCTANLSDPAVVPGENFNTVLYTGNGSTQSITGVGFQPDFVWNKPRSFGGSPVNGHNTLYDVIRGATKELYSDLTSGEATNGGSLTSFDADGFSVGSEPRNNASGQTYVGWNWKADNTSGSTNTDGSITSTVAANPDAGFSIVSYTGNGGNGVSIGHGLSQTPDIVILKARNGSYTSVGWGVVSHLLGSTSALKLNTTDAAISAGGISNNTLPTSTTFTVADNFCDSGADHIAYCFHSVDGFSKFGSYEGNSSTDGTFVYTGFRPAFVMVKKTDGAGVDGWTITDTDRDPINVADQRIQANSSSAEAGDVDLVDHLSNGFKIRYNGQMNNQSGTTYIYMAFAEYPFKFTNAR